MNNEVSDTEESPDREPVTGYFVQLPNDASSDDFDFREIWHQLVQQKLMIAGVIIGVTVLSFVLSLFMEPVYRSSILFAPTSTIDHQSNLASLVGQYGGLAPLGGFTLAGDNSKDQTIAVLRSRRFTQEFIQSENLMPVFFSKLWDHENGRWLVDSPEDAPTMADAFDLFNQTIRFVEEDARRGLVTLSIDWSDRELAAHWANQLVERLNNYLRVRDIAEAERSIEFLNKELAKSSVIEIRQGIFRLIENQIEMIMLANVRDEYVMKILDPAVAADADRFVKPNRRLIVAVGFLLGSFLAVVLVMIRSGREQETPT